MKVDVVMDGGKETAACDKRSFAETAGRAMAECTAVFCCCPCTVMNVVWSVAILPAGILMKLKKKMEQKKKPKKAVLERRDSFWPSGDLEREARELMESVKVDVANRGSEKEEVDREKEMWALFYGTGFWRSPSQKDS